MKTRGSWQRDGSREELDGLLIMRADEVFRSAVPPISPRKALWLVVEGCWKAEAEFLASIAGDLEQLQITDIKGLRHKIGPSIDSAVKRLLSRLENRDYRRDVSTNSGPKKTLATWLSTQSKFANLPIAKAIDRRRGSRPQMLDHKI